MASFRNALESVNLNDLSFSSPIFTWDNGREDPHTIRERLDRVVAK